jgi:hypothetical protein
MITNIKGPVVVFSSLTAVELFEPPPTGMRGASHPCDTAKPAFHSSQLLTLFPSATPMVPCVL